jgi:hypothetical protein
MSDYSVPISEAQATVFSVSEKATVRGKAAAKRVDVDHEVVCL